VQAVMRRVSPLLRFSKRPVYTLLTSCAFFRPVAIRMAHTLPRLPIFEAIARHDPSRIAVIHSLSGRSFTYGSLIHDVVDAARRLREGNNGASLDGERVAILIENSYDYVGAR
jgi:malonyl-CoA/methylmalonyl-CoA synthetase